MFILTLFTLSHSQHRPTNAFTMFSCDRYSTNVNVVSHVVFQQTDLLKEGDVPVPYPTKYRDAWDEQSVRMPCSEKNLFPVESEVGTWNLMFLIFYTQPRRKFTFNIVKSPCISLRMGTRSEVDGASFVRLC